MHVVQCLSTYKYSMNYLYVVAYFIYFTSQRPSEIKRGNHRRTVAGGSNGGRGRTGLGLGNVGWLGCLRTGSGDSGPVPSCLLGTLPEVGLASCVAPDSNFSVPHPLPCNMEITVMCRP